MFTRKTYFLLSLMLFLGWNQNLLSDDAMIEQSMTEWSQETTESIIDSGNSAIKQIKEASLLQMRTSTRKQLQTDLARHRPLSGPDEILSEEINQSQEKQAARTDRPLEEAL